jgi:soluble lytic murein transglycosylase-like protein
MPEDLIYLAVAESSLDINAVSPAKAAGIWQFMPATGKQYGLEVNDDVDERFDPEKETVAACKYLRGAYSRYGNWATVCASYNAGTGKISSELSSQRVNTSFDLRLVSETSRYVFRIMSYKIFLENPKRFGYRLHSNQLYQHIDYDVIEVDTPVSSWVSWAQDHGITYAQLRDANPWIRSTKLPNASGKVYKVKVPKQASLYRSKAGNKVYNDNWVVD